MVFKNKSKQTGTGLKNSILYKMLNASYTDKNETPNFIYSKNSVYD